MTGVSFPVAKSSLKRVKSCLFSFAMKKMNFWLMNRDHTSDQRGDQTGQETEDPATA